MISYSLSNFPSVKAFRMRLVLGGGIAAIGYFFIGIVVQKLMAAGGAFPSDLMNYLYGFWVPIAPMLATVSTALLSGAIVSGIAKRNHAWWRPCVGVAVIFLVVWQGINLLQFFVFRGLSPVQWPDWVPRLLGFLGEMCHRMSFMIFGLVVVGICLFHHRRCDLPQPMEKGVQAS